MVRESFDIGPAKGADALRESVSRSCANRAGTAHDHIGDCSGGLAELSGLDHDKLMRQQALVDEHNGIVLRFEGDGAIVACSSADSDVHERDG
jgi:hypothetical protein